MVVLLETWGECFFSWTRSSILPLVSSFHDFWGFFYFSDDPLLDNDGDEKDKKHVYSVDEDNHDDKEAMKSKEIMHHCKRNKKRNHNTVGEKLNVQLVTWPFLATNSRCLLLRNYPLCNIWRGSRAITSPIIWPAKQTYTWSKSLESVLIQMHKKLKDLLMLMSIVSLPSYELYWSI